MMRNRIFSCAIVFSAVAFVGAMNGSEALKNGLQKAGGNVGTIMGIAIASAAPAEDDAAKAAIETSGVLLDQVLAGNDKIRADLLAANFVANVVVRKGIRCLDANDIKLPNPDLGKAGNHVGRPVRDAVVAAAPQVIAGLVVMACVK
jgi:hypothetical protein